MDKIKHMRAFFAVPIPEQLQQELGSDTAATSTASWVFGCEVGAIRKSTYYGAISRQNKLCRMCENACCGNRSNAGNRAIHLEVFWLGAVSLTAKPKGNSSKISGTNQSFEIKPVIGGGDRWL